VNSGKAWVHGTMAMPGTSNLTTATPSTIILIDLDWNSSRHGRSPLTPEI
jgi:hypothetical protein